MSVSEVEDLCKILASLNYDGQQTILTPELFSKPNFNLICDILNWFVRIVQTYDNNSNEIGSFLIKTYSINMIEQPEEIRVAYLTNVGKLFYSTLGIKLNLVNLYRADNFSCRELLKIGEFVHKAAKYSLDMNEVDNKLLIDKLIKERSLLMEQLYSIIDNSENGNDVYSDITQLSTDLDNLLNSEENFNEERLKVMDRPYELKKIQSVLKSVQVSIVDKTKEFADSNEELKKDLERLDGRLELKELELEKVKNRLNDLMIQHPAYYDQYEKLHDLYVKSYEAYVSKYRNYMYLKSCVYTGNSNSFDNNYQGDLFDFQRANPDGSINELSLLTSPDETAGRDDDGTMREAAGAADDAELTGGGLTIGPARLAESLFDGTSKPISASLKLEPAGLLGALGTGVVDGGAEYKPEEVVGIRGALERAGAAGGTAPKPPPTVGRRITTVGRPATAGDATIEGLEFEGLLSEFVADSEALAGDDSTATTEEGSRDEDDDDTEGDDDSLVDGGSGSGTAG